MGAKRQQMNVRLNPDLIAAGDAERNALGLSRDKYVEMLYTDRLARRQDPEPDPAAALAEAEALAARIRGDSPVPVNL
jgi:hypothetical protein